MATTRRAQHSTHFEQRVRHEKERQDSFAREDLTKKLAADQLIITNSLSDDRVMDKRRHRIMNKEAREREIVSSISEEAERRRKQAQRVQQDEAIASQLATIRDGELRDEKLRQQIRETDPELRALKSKLDAGYANRELQGQITTHAHQQLERTLAKDETARELASERERWEDESIRETEQNFQKMTMHRHDLEVQLGEEENRKVAAYEQFMKEKAMIDDIVQRIHHEDSAFASAEAAKKTQTKQEQEDFFRMQEDFRLKEEQRRRIENEELQRQARDLESRAQGEKQAKAAALAATEALAARMGANVAQERAMRDELDDARQVLHEEQALAKLREDEEKEIETKFYRRLEMQRDHDEAVFIKQQRRNIEVAEEQDFRQAMLDKFARDDRLEQMSAQKRRMKGLEHGRAVEQLMIERRQRLEFERQQAVADLQFEQEAADRRRALIEQERQKLLREHAIKLLGYLPKGVIRDEGDLATLGDDFTQRYTAKPEQDPFY